MEKTSSAAGSTGKSAHHRPRIRHEVTFVAYPKLLFVWPLILAGYLFWPLGWPAQPDAASDQPPAATVAPDQPADAGDAADAGEPATTQLAQAVSGRLENLAWIYIWIALAVLLALGVDVDRNHAVFWAVVIVAFWILGMWLQERQYTLFGDIYRWFANLDIQYNRNLGLALSVLLSVPFVIMLVYARLNDYWRITHNEFEHYSFGKSDDSVGRGAKTIRTTFPDVLELILGLAGTLIVFNATGTKELRRVPHVICLPLVRRRLNRILEKTAITQMAAADEEEDDDEDNSYYTARNRRGAESAEVAEG